MAAGHDQARAAAERVAAVLWQPAPPRARGPKPKLTREDVVEAAIAIADADGLPAASLRAIAERLDASIAGLYRYVPGKTELIALMVERAQGEAATTGSDAQGWREELEGLAIHDWDLYHRHPWLLDLPLGRIPPGPSTVARFDAGLGAALRAGLAPARAVSAVTAIDHLVTGAARDSVQKLTFARGSGMDAMQWWTMHGDVSIGQHMATGEYPWLSQVITEGGFQQTDPREGDDEMFLADFREALDLLLDGIAQRL